MQDDAGDGDALVFAAGKGGAAFAHGGLVALRQGGDEVVALGGAGGGFYFRIAGVRRAEADVVGDAAAEQEVVLEDEGDLRHQGFGGEVADVGAADADAAAVGVPKAGDEADGGGFACAAAAD